MVFGAFRKMNIISHRECRLFKVTNEDLNRFLKEIKQFLKKEGIPEDYSIILHEDEITCCGLGSLREVAVEIQGPAKQPRENLDMKIYSKILEICERKSIEYHECNPPKFLDTLKMLA